MMKTISKYILTFVAILMVTTLSSQTYNGGTWYSLYDTEQKNNTTVATNFCEKAVFAPAESITFDYKKYTGISINGKLQVQNNVNGSWSGSKGEVSYSSTSWKTSHAIALDADISHIRYRMPSGTGASVRNHFVKLKKHIRIADGGYGKTSESKSFGNVTIGNVSAVQTVKLRSFLTAGNITITSNNPAFRVGSSSNQGAHAFNVGTNACASTNGASGTPASGGTLGDINLYDINIYFAPTAAGEQSGTITISDGTSSATISVSGVGMKKTQTIAWTEALSGSDIALPMGKTITPPANAQTEITYSVENDTIISINGNTLTALNAGTTTITATAVENEEWLSATSTITVKVTEKKVQYIHWNDNLTRLKVGGEPVLLTATAWVLIDPKTETQEENPERTPLITYASANNNIVSVSGNVLIIVGEGETTLTATLPGDDVYEGVVISTPVHVRAVSTSVCEAYVLDDSQTRTLNTIDSEEYTINGPADKLTFTANREKLVGFSDGNLKVDQYYNGGWHNIFDQGVSLNDYTQYASIQLNRNATKLKFYTETGATGYKNIKDVAVTMATYLETTTPEIVVERSIIGAIIDETIRIQYSNLPDDVPVVNNSDKITVKESGLGNVCGEYGEKELHLTIRPTEIGVIEDVITIHDEATGKKLEIPVTVHVQRNTQTIDWEQNITALNTTDNITLSAEAKTPIYYTSSDSTIAYTEGNQLIINKYGHVTITAVAPQDEKYEQATASKEITISIVQPTVSVWPTVEPIAYAQALTLTTDMLIGGEAEVEGYFDWNTERNQTLVPGTYDLAVRFIPTNTNYYASVDGIVSVTIVESVINDTPTFVGGTDQSWTTPTNWNLNRVPNAEDSVIINAPVEITDGAVEVLGMTINAGGAIHIAPTGGLTVGKGGIAGVAANNITIDNNTQGVGFLRINPDAKSIPTNVTINYTTRGKSGNPRDEVWQYVGAPGANMSMTNEGVLIYHWSEQNGWVKATTAMAPFVGYAISRTTTGNDTYTITTTPVLDNHAVELTRTPSGMDGSNLFVNSYLAPIDLAKFELGVDIVGNVEQTFYLFNSGSWNDWQNDGGGNDSIVNGTSPGQYFAITPGSAALLDASMDQTTIPPMQGVYVVANESATIHLDYNKHVFTSTSADMNRPMRAPQQQDLNFMRVRIQVNSDNSGADRMYVIQHENATKGYDNGYDAKNILADGQANIYTHEQDGQMEISVTNQLDSTYIGFAAGDDAVYTLTFTSLVGEEMYLYDIEQDILIPLAEQEQYTFYAQPNSVNNQRFILLLNPDDAGNISGGDGVATDIENLSASSHIWFSGKTLHVADAPANTTLAIYSACGMCIMAPNGIPSAPYALDLSHLPMGVYVLRLNNQAYKFVCK